MSTTPSRRIVLAQLCSAVFSVFFSLAEAAGVDQRLLGRWVCDVGEVTVEMTFLPNGLFKGRLIGHGGVSFAGEGKWSVEGNRLFYLYTKYSIPRNQESKPDVDILIEVGDGFFVVQAHDGQRRRYTRVQ